jgi:hypothetical protein
LEISGEDIDAAVPRDDVELGQPHLFIAGMNTGVDVVFIAMPRADYVDVVLVESLADKQACVVDDVLNLRQPQTLADRSSLVGALVAIGYIPSAMHDDTDLASVLADNPDITVGYLADLADKQLSHWHLIV